MAEATTPLANTWGRRENVRILVIGAGGIGCEVLKNLVLSGFRSISILDMDRVDVSNLNRQFLFTKKDVGLYKADTAARAIRSYVRHDNEFKIEVHRTMVQELPLEVFRRHDLIISALDNVDGRKFVNRMCLTCEIPLMEAGSTGKNGQGYCLYSKAGTECFECRDQPKATGYPVCTIRLTAEKPEHCVAWARYLFESIFSLSDGRSAPTTDDNALTDLADHIWSLKPPKDTAELKDGEPCLAEGGGSNFAKRVALYLFEELVNSYLQLKATEDHAASNKKHPEPLSWLRDDAHFWTIEKREVDSSASAAARVVQPKEYYAEQFMIALNSCVAKYQRRCMKFDKDDEDTMAFVASAANLRMLNFNIPMMNSWDLKTMAGAIQPAIASTNAIVAAIEVLNLIRICPLLAKGKDIGLKDLNEAGARFIWTRAEPADGRLLLAELLDPPKPRCLVCANDLAIVRLSSFAKWPLSRFVSEVLERRLGGHDITILNSKTILYDPELIQDSPQIGLRLFEGNSELITISWPGVGAFDMIVLEEEKENLPSSDCECKIVKGLPERTLTNDAWRAEPSSMRVVTEIDDPDETVLQNIATGKRPRSSSLDEGQAAAAKARKLD